VINLNYRIASFPKELDYLHPRPSQTIFRAAEVGTPTPAH